MSTNVRMGFRVVATATAAALAASLAGFLPANAAADMPAAKSNSAWLIGKMVDGKYESFPGTPDYGLTVDVLLAMAASGNLASAAPILNALETRGEIENFITFAGFLGEDGLDDRVGGAVAKSLVAAEAAGSDPRNFAGWDLVAETQATISTDAATLGKVQDSGPNTPSDAANTFGQAFAVLGLAAVRANNTNAINALLKQQCSEGFFRIIYHMQGGAIQTCDQGKSGDLSPTDGDTTGLALSALLAARDAGAAGLDDDIRDAITWLEANQAASGGWGGGAMTEAPNTNSTGLIVHALKDAGGNDSIINKGVAYLKGAQVTSTADSTNDLSDDIGAIAYTPADYVSARTGGIGEFAVGTWVRASAQASLGLSQVGFRDLLMAPKRLTVKATPSPVLAGAVVNVSVGSLASGELFALSSNGVQLASDTANASGSGRIAIQIPTTWNQGPARLTVVGERATRSGSVTLQVVKAERLKPKLKAKVFRGGKQRVSVASLAPGEKVTVRYGSKKWTGFATPRGTFTKVFKVGLKPGKKIVKVVGAYANRNGAKKFKVVKR